MNSGQAKIQVFEFALELGMFSFGESGRVIDDFVLIGYNYSLLNL
jgi:hypothetical protein